MRKLDWHDGGGKEGRRREGGDESYFVMVQYSFVFLFVCLFVELFVFYFNHIRTPTGIYPENFMRMGLDLAEILRI